METLEQVVERVARAVTVAQNCQSRVQGDAAYCTALLGCGRTGKCNTPHASADVERVRAALTALARTHALVPREASAEAQWAGESAMCSERACECEPSRVYSAMLSASDLLASMREGG